MKVKVDFDFHEFEAIITPKELLKLWVLIANFSIYFVHPEAASTDSYTECQK